MTDDIPLDELQRAVNNTIYESVVFCYQKVSSISDESKAANAIMSSLATNLGILIAQMPEDQRQRYFDICHKIISQSMTDVLEGFDTWQYGTVGHA
jgi:hypothetical protein